MATAMNANKPMVAPVTAMAMACRERFGNGAVGVGTSVVYPVHVTPSK